MSPRPLLASLTLTLATIIVGLLIRFAPLGLPIFLVKYGGSLLWALMLYWIISALLPSWRLSSLVLATGSLATAVEFFKLFHAPRLDDFRLTIPGILLLGRMFSVWDILAYWLAILAGAAIDRRIRRQAHLSSDRQLRS